MAPKTSWHRHGTKFRHCHPMYSVSEPCNATWTLYRASNAFGGSRLSTANDVTTCLQGCNANRRCRAADYNASSPIGRRCFLHFSTGAARVNVGLFTAVSHYSISRVCPSTDKNVPLQGGPKSCTFFFGTVQDKMKRISPKCFFSGNIFVKSVSFYLERFQRSGALKGIQRFWDTL